MERVGYGSVQNGQVMLAEPLDFPEGTEVVVHIEIVDGAETAPPTTEHFTSLPFFGMWADRADMSDSVAWVEKERRKWPRRNENPD